MLWVTCASGALPSRFEAAVFGDLVRASCTDLGRAGAHWERHFLRMDCFLGSGIGSTAWVSLFVIADMIYELFIEMLGSNKRPSFLN